MSRAPKEEWLIISAYSVNDDVLKLERILDALLNYLCNKYGKDHFWYRTSLFLIFLLVFTRFYVRDELNSAELALYERFLKNMPQRIYCSLR